MVDEQQAEPELLEKFDAPNRSGRMECKFTTDELTAHCPFDFGGPDFYELEIVYVPDDATVESRSLKKYIESYRDVQISGEKLATDIHKHIESVIEPDELYVELQQARRGGMEETVTVGELSSK